MSARVVHLALLLAVGVAGFAPVARPVGPTRRAGAVQCRLNAGGKGPLQMAGTEGEGGEVRKGRFLAYVKSEKELEEWKKANPVDPVQVLKGPLTSVAILTAGYYAIPIVRGIADGVREGDIVGALARELSNPSGSLNPGTAVSPPTADASVLQSVADAISSGS